ncbi:MAG: putative Ig domain-containing protein [Bryobacterales bacterium]|nr:putative Ig domain-containing protein [Bryobacterales bacterium]
MKQTCPPFAIFLTALLAAAILLAAPANAQTLNVGCPAPRAHQFEFYESAATASGGQPTYFFEVIAGALPTGLELNETGPLDGTPTAVGIFTFTVQVADNNDDVAQRECRIEVRPRVDAGCPLSFANVGSTYSSSIPATGGFPPYTYGVDVTPFGSFPPDLVLDPATGAISGIPRAEGSHSFGLLVTDSAGYTFRSRGFERPDCTITVFPPVPISASCLLPPALLGEPFQGQVTAFGGAPPLRYTLAFGLIPPGLSLDQDTGTIGGVPTTPGGFNFTVGVGDNFGSQTALAECRAVVTTPLQAACPSTPGQVGVSYSSTVAVTGGTAPYTFQLVSGQLPPGLFLNTFTGAVTGTPLEEGSYPIVIRISDSSNPQFDSFDYYNGTLASNLTTDLECVIEITPPPPPLSATCAVGSGVVGTPYSSGVAASGGTGPYTFTLVSGQLPPGLTFDPATGQIAGTPLTAGAFAYRVRVQDSSSPVQTVETDCTIVIDPAPLTAACAVGPGQRNQPYAGAVTATGGSPGYGFLLTAGALPPGLTLSAGGLIAGTPTTVGTFPFAVTVTDSENDTALAECSITISSDAPPLTAACAVNPGQASVPFSGAVVVSGGEPGYTFAVTGGTVPGGLTLNPATGAIGGTPDGPGFSVFDVTVTDSAGTTATARCTVPVDATPVVPACAAGPGTVGAPYQGRVSVTGGQQPFLFEVISGSVPPGLLLDPRSGGLSGTPVTPGFYTFGVQVTHAGAGAGVTECGIQVRQRPLVTGCQIGAATAGQLFSGRITASGGESPYVFTLAPDSILPPGLALGADGSVTGAPTEAGQFPFTVLVSDSAPGEFRQTRPQTCSLTVAPEPLQTRCNLPRGLVGRPFPAATLRASGGTPPYRWALESRFVPGLALSPDGSITGVPTTVGRYPFTASVTDSGTGGLQQSATLSCEIIVDVTGLSTACPLGFARTGAPYASAFTVDLGTAPYQWSVANGALPPGLVLNPETGGLAGTANQAGAFNFVAEVRDSGSGEFAQRHQFSCEIDVAPSLEVSCALPPGTVDQPYSGAVNATGGLSPLFFTVSSGTPPPGVGVRTLSGNVLGAPREAGQFTFNVAVRDSAPGDFQAQVETACTVEISAEERPPVNVDVTSVDQAPPGATPRIGVQTRQALPTTLSGTIALEFTADAAAPAGYSDPAMQFASGGRQVSFIVPEGSTEALVPQTGLIQPGTVAGRITARLVRLEGFGGANVLPDPTPARQIIVPRLAPVIVPGSLRIQNVTPAGFEVRMVAYSTPRDLTNARLTFESVSGPALEGETTFQVDLANTARQYYDSPAGLQNGGVFELRIPFTVSVPVALRVTVTLSNSVGTSAPATGQ